MARKEVVFILGMSRTGTSAMTRVLSLCGLDLPDDLVEPNYANPTGFWEPIGAVILNETFLRDHGSSWCDPAMPPLNEKIQNVDEAETFIDKIGSLLCASPGERPLVIKDPRIASLAPFWFEAAKRSGLVAKVIISIRHPFEVASSLAKRDGAAVELSDALWLKASFLAERQSRNFQRVITEYVDLLSDWRTQITRIEKALDIDLSHRDEEAIDAFLDPALYTQRTVARPPAARMLPWLLPTYEHLLGCAHEIPMEFDAMDKSYTEFVDCADVFVKAEDDALRIGNTLGIFGGHSKTNENEAPEERIASITVERDALLALRQKESDELSKSMALIKGRMSQLSAATLVPVTGPVVLERETRGFEPDGWMLKAAAFTCRAVGEVSTIVFSGWMPGTGGETEITAVLGEATFRAAAPAGESFTFTMPVTVHPDQAVVVELTVHPYYCPAMQLPGSQDDRELGCIIQRVSFS